MSTFLSNLRIFKSDNAKDIISTLLRESHIERFSASTRIIEENSASNNCGYILLSGSVEVFIGWERIATLGVGDIFGEYAPIVQRDRTATVVAITNITCLVLKKWILLRLIAVGSGLNDILLRRIRENTKHKRGVFGTYS